MTTTVVFGENGIQNGISKVYYENGQIKEECNYVDGHINGICRTYFKDGSINFEGNYVMDKKNGPFKLYQSPGKLLMTGSYKNDRLDGEITAYSPLTGKPMGPLTYKDGKAVRPLQQK